MIADIFIAVLKKSFISTLMELMTHWQQYVDEAIAMIKLTSIKHILSIFISFYKNIKFTYGLQQDCQINFLDFFID